MPLKKSYFDSRVSFFNSVHDTAPASAKSLREVLFGDRFRSQIEKLRTCTDEAERRRLKSLLPAFTPAGTFNVRKVKGLAEPSGLLSIDLDEKDHKHLAPELWQNLSKHFSPTRHPSILYAGRSCSGGGWWLLIRLADPSPAAFKTNFESISADLAQMGLVVDRSGSDISRCRFVSYDHEPYINEDAKPYRLPASFKFLRGADNEHGAGLVEDDSAAWVGFKIAEYLQIIGAHEIDVLSDYESWRNAAYALLTVFTPEHARGLYHRLSAFYPGYSPAETDAQFDACLVSQQRGGAGIGVGTLLKILREKCAIYSDFQNITID